MSKRKASEFDDDTQAKKSKSARFTTILSPKVDIPLLPDLSNLVLSYDEPCERVPNIESECENSGGDLGLNYIDALRDQKINCDSYCNSFIDKFIADYFKKSFSGIILQFSEDKKDIVVIDSPPVSIKMSSKFGRLYLDFARPNIADIITPRPKYGQRGYRGSANNYGPARQAIYKALRNKDIYKYAASITVVYQGSISGIRNDWRGTSSNLLTRGPFFYHGLSDVTKKTRGTFELAINIANNGSFTKFHYPRVEVIDMSDD